MLSFAAWPLFLVKLQPLWGLSNFSTGWVGGPISLAMSVQHLFWSALQTGLMPKYLFVLLSYSGCWRAVFCPACERVLERGLELGAGRGRPGRDLYARASDPKCQAE